MALKFTVPEIITVEDYLEFYREKEQVYKYRKEDIGSSIATAISQINSICPNNLLYKCWNETDTKSIYYRNETEKGFIQQAVLAQTKYVLDNCNDLEEEAITSYGSGSINFSKNKKKKATIPNDVLEYLSKARIYRAIKDTPINEETELDTINKITKMMLEICDRRYVSKYIDNDTHLVHTYTNRNFDVMPISDLGQYISTQIYDEINNIWRNVNLLQNWYNYLLNKYRDLEERVEALEDNNNE